MGRKNTNKQNTMNIHEEEITLNMNNISLKEYKQAKHEAKALWKEEMREKDPGFTKRGYKYTTIKFE